MTRPQIRVPLRLRRAMNRPGPVAVRLDPAALAAQVSPTARLALRAGRLTVESDGRVVRHQFRHLAELEAAGAAACDLAWVAGPEQGYVLELPVLDEADGEAGLAAPPAAAERFPRVQMLPAPDHRLDGCIDGRPVMTVHYAPREGKPYLHPLAGPASVPLTRMGHPPDAEGRRHQHGVWVAHREINRVNFWDDREGYGRQTCLGVDELEDGPVAGAATLRLRWESPEGETVLHEARGLTLCPLPDGEVALDLELELRPAGSPARFSQTPFGLLGLRVARSMSVLHGGGRIEASTGLVNETGVFHTRARWCDYSGPVTPQAWNGVAVFDHPDNPHHPCYWQVRDDGWMGAATCYEAGLVLEPDEVLRLRYRLVTHTGEPADAGIDGRYEDWVDPPAVTLGAVEVVSAAP